jgi:acetylornithine/succinyldiaminopimelate/putrescine aminotransferase
MEPRHPLFDTIEQMLRDQTPNLLRLYLNPYVVQTCLCLDRYIETTWPWAEGKQGWQSFLANCFDEALSGAIKLARYSGNVAGKPSAGLIVDPGGRVGPFAGAPVAAGMVEFVPGLAVVGKEADIPTSGGPIGLLVLVARPGLERHADAIRSLVQRDAPLVIICVDRDSLGSMRREPTNWLREITPDIVVFDESFVDRAVPFSAFSAGKTLFDHWNQPGKTTFHSTTYQPNTISTMHFMRCLEKADPEFHAALAKDLAFIRANLEDRGRAFRDLYNPSLYRMIRTTGFDAADVRAAGDFVIVNGKPIFDAVSGVACSVRGHNPATYLGEIAAMAGAAECETELAGRLRDLTGLDHMVPAVSGATAVENALKLALVAQFPRRHVLALKAGFGGKTLLALTGTANPSYKDRIDPLYADVLYVDPFAADAEAEIERMLKQYPVAVVQVELIQAVGGVRRIPENVIRYLDSHRQQDVGQAFQPDDGAPERPRQAGKPDLRDPYGYLLLVDEVQTGMCRTGPFTMSRALGLTPDLLLLGKATSDMIFPFALTLYSRIVQEKLDAAGSDLPAVLRRRNSYEFGFKTVLNVLRLTETLSLPARVAESGALFAKLLGDGLASCGSVREVRVYGLLIGIELDASRWPLSWFRKKLYSFYLYSMLRHRAFPVLVGFCQYEPNVLKITPALNVAPEQIRAVCTTIIDVLHRPFPRLVAAAAGGLLGSLGFWRKSHEHGNSPAHDAVVR